MQCSINKTLIFSHHNSVHRTHISKVVAMTELQPQIGTNSKPQIDQVMNTDNKPNIVGDANPKLSKSSNNSNSHNDNQKRMVHSNTTQITKIVSAQNLKMSGSMEIQMGECSINHNKIANCKFSLELKQKSKLLLKILYLNRDQR